MAKRVVLAYSGGLDTSVAVRWMIEELGVEVICLAVDVGQASDDWDVVRDRAKAGRAAGNTGDLYDNRDRGHSVLDPALNPQLARTDYARSRHAYLVNELRLKQAAGILEATDLQATNRVLVADANAALDNAANEKQ